jgi:predicted lipid-binding transport protein (Tim44 family)
MDPVVLIFAALAAFVIFKLISVLGTRDGHEQRHDVKGLQRASSAETSAPAQPEIDEPQPRLAAVSPAAEPLREVDPQFDERGFLEGAKSAYEMIVEAFAAGDLKSIRRYLATPVYEAFKGAVVAREAAEHNADLKFVGIDSAKIVEARVEDGEMIAVIDFASNQVRATTDKAGVVVDGDPNRIDLVRDRWSFSRKVKANDPNWILIATDAQA